MIEFGLFAAIVLGLAGTALGIAHGYVLHPRLRADHDGLADEVAALRSEVFAQQRDRPRPTARPSPRARPVPPLATAVLPPERTDTAEAAALITPDAVIVDEETRAYARAWADAMQARLAEERGTP